jgi:tRNA(Ile2)-agmatinylcytidine synthase
MPPTYLSADDTDSLDGMCTTYLATLLIEELSPFDLVGFPRLVRLNPNVPWKTRGNAAISLAFGRGKGRKFRVGEIQGETIFSFEEGDPAPEREIYEAARKVISENAHFACENTNPGFVVSGRRPSPNFYWRTVREIVPIASAEKEIAKAGGVAGKFKSGRGIIGATAAMAWRPRDLTFEVLSYRKEGNIGRKREIDRKSVEQIEKAFPTTFHNIDSDTGHIAIAPGSPCPVLFGIRGDDPTDLVRARTMIESEPADRWLLFLTNQATDDHLRKMRIYEVRPRTGAILSGVVSQKAFVIEGGHVFFRMRDSSAELTCAVYEPSGSMRKAARELREGDRIEVYGSARAEPFEINVEKLHVIETGGAGEKIENPVCHKCGKHMKSAGRGAGYFRCRRCGTRADIDAARWSERKTPAPGWYEPPIASRRHLYKPLKRFGIERRSIRELLNSYLSDEASSSQR